MFLYGKYIGLCIRGCKGISHHPAHPPFLHLLVDLSKIFYKRSCWRSMNRCQVKLYDQLQCFQNQDCALASSPRDRWSGEVLKFISKLGTDSFNNLPKSSSKEGTKDLIFLVEKSNSQKSNFLSRTFSWPFINSKYILKHSILHIHRL